MRTRINQRHLMVWIPTLLLAGSIALLQGCATPATSGNMMARSESIAQAPRDASQESGITVGNVRGGSETNPLWMSKVSNADFKVALEDSLKSARLHAADPSPARFQLDATLLSLDQPMFGLDLTVTCTAQYELLEPKSGNRVFTKTVTAAFTASFSDALLGVERLRIANEGAVRENIRKLLTELFSLDFSQAAPPSSVAR